MTVDSPGKALHVAFYAEHLYYLPQFLPVIEQLRQRGHRVSTLLRVDATTAALLPPGGTIPELPDLERVDSTAEAYARLRELAPQWAVFGSFLDEQEKLAGGTQTALIYHGIGVKSVLFDPRLNAFDLRCVESQRVLDELLERAPETAPRLALVGFAKLDPLFRAPPPAADRQRHVVLYAPTFYPSSLELMPERLSSLAPDVHWIVKPHFFTWTIDKYAEQRKRLRGWAEEPNVEVLGAQNYNLVPLMARADLMISDASSALFEFAALRKPVLWCRFQKVRWSYRGLLSWRLKNRIDPQTSRYEAVATCADNLQELRQALPQLLAPGYTPGRQREELVEYLIGPRDGLVSHRVVAELEARAR